MKIGYIRMSTNNEQSLNRQKQQLEEYGCDRLFIEKQTGTKRDRTELNRMFEELETGDTVVVTDISRLSRNELDAKEIHEVIAKKGALLKSLKE